MKNKTVNLSAWMFLKVVPAALLLLYYWMCTIEGYNPVFRYIHAATLVLSGAIVWAQISYARKNKIFDEFAKENLKTTDSICLKVAYVLMIAATLACVFTEFSGIAAGYFVVGSILLLTNVRAIMFAVIDSNFAPRFGCGSSH